MTRPNVREQIVGQDGRLTTAGYRMLVGGDMDQATATQIADVASDVNRRGKFAGRFLIDSTNTRLVMALGGAPDAAWIAMTVAATVNPA